MVAAWKLAEPKQRIELIEHLTNELDVLQKQLLVARLKPREDS